jgi:hypothetical protein
MALHHEPPGRETRTLFAAARSSPSCSAACGFAATGSCLIASRLLSALTCDFLTNREHEPHAARFLVTAWR